MKRNFDLLRFLVTPVSILTLLGCASVPRSGALPAGVTFDGKWDSNFHEMVLHQQGRHVWGTVGYRDGSLEGQVEGSLIHFKWFQRENKQSGHGFLQMSPDGSHLEGRWGYLESDDDGGRWWAERAEGGAAPVELRPARSMLPPGGNETLENEPPKYEP